ncbi:MAG: antitoxin family protein [Desulfurococcales archaeon]|nr:antitoxin family protein [Desulfurococcales archaeon]
MSKVIRVRYEKGALRPIDYVEFNEGEEFEIVVVKRTFRGFREEAGKYRFEVDHDVVGEFVVERR